jgi:hypothetical protein
MQAEWGGQRFRWRIECGRCVYAEPCECRHLPAMPGPCPHPPYRQITQEIPMTKPTSPETPSLSVGGNGSGLVVRWLAQAKVLY